MDKRKKRIPWNKGIIGTKKHSKKSKEKLSKITKERWKKGELKSRFGKEAPAWRGNNVGYRGIHHWVQNNLGKANHCEKCGLDKIPEGKKRFFQWANISRKYKRKLFDWKQLCVKCHINFDKKYAYRRSNKKGD